jgi:hypothetical protein
MFHNYVDTRVQQLRRQHSVGVHEDRPATTMVELGDELGGRCVVGVITEPSLVLFVGPAAAHHQELPDGGMAAYSVSR